MLFFHKHERYYTMNESKYTETLELLQQQKKELEQKIQKQIQTEKKLHLNNIIADMITYKISVQDIQVAFEKKQRVSKVRYINPETGATWSGIGKRPKWVVEALEEGKTIQDFAVK